MLYPAWQVPLFYVFAALGIAVTCRFVSSFRKQHKSYVTIKMVMARYVSPIAISLLVLAVLLIRIVISSKGTISTVMHTAYPGARVERGGGLTWNLFNYMQSIFGPLTPDSVLPNVCEQAVFLSLFPLGIILAIWVTTKQRDSVIVTLLATDAILYTFGLVGFPTLLAKTTMLSNVTTGRLQMATTLIDVLLLFRSIVLINERNDRYNAKRMNYLNAVLFSVLLSCVVIAGSTIASGYPIRAKILVAMGVLMSVCFFFVFMSIRYSESASVYVGLLACVVLVAGVCINPVQYGSAALTDNSTISQVKQRIDNPDIAVLATDSPFVGQAFIANGVPTITSTNSVPALERWRKIDPQGKYQTVYNRYAHIGFDIKNEGAALFELNQPDSITVHLTVSDLEAIGVTHLLTKQVIDHKDVMQEGHIGEYYLYSLRR